MSNKFHQGTLTIISFGVLCKIALTLENDGQKQMTLGNSFSAEIHMQS